MIDVVLLCGRLLLVALLYLFLFAIMRTGIAQVKGAQIGSKHWHLLVEKGPKELRGINMTVTGPLVVGRAPGSDIVIGGGYVSGRHAKFDVKGQNLFVEDLDSKNGTILNGHEVYEPTAVHNKDKIQIGDVVISARYE